MGQLRSGQAPDAALTKIFGWKQLRIVSAIDKRIGVGTPLLGLGQCGPIQLGAQDPTTPVGRNSVAGIQRLDAGRQLGACIGRHKDAAPGPCLQKSIVYQLQKGRGDRVATQAQQAGQFARRRHCSARAKPPPHDRLNHGQPKAPLKRQGRLCGQLK